MKVKIGSYPKWRWFNYYLHEWFGYTPEQQVSIKIDRWDTYSVDYNLARVILPLLTKFKEENTSYPNDLNSIEEWGEILDDMIFAFSWRLTEEWYSTSEEDREKALEGFKLFGKWYCHLWW